jgi:membrane protein YqaA with SNARE-associated domain
MLQRTYARVLALAGSRYATWWLALIAFAEASFFPIPPDALLIPMALAKPRKAWRFAAICTVASVAGGALGYFIGFAVFDQVARPILDLYGYGAAYAAFQAKFQEYGLWIILVKGLTPIPYKIVTIAAGAARFDVWVFMMASVLTRGARFFLVATLLHFFGDSVRDFIERRLTLVTSALAAALVGGFVALKLL